MCKKNVSLPDEGWVCPSCNSPNVSIYDRICDDDDCVHTNDFIYCEDCGKTVKFSSIIKKYNEKQNLITCPCCKGKGKIKKEVVNGN